MNFRTDLAIEWSKQSYIDSGEIKSATDECDGIKITTTEIDSDSVARKIGKPKGKYITIEAENFDTLELVNSTLAKVLTREISALLPDGNALVCGIGNSEITPDALGPKCVSRLLATRHIGEELAKQIGFENLRSVSAISPGVLGQTGIEIGEVIHSLCEKTNPDFVVVIDALASKSMHRLGRTIQIGTSGIVPGSGVHASRKEISKKTLGVPVIAIGVPTVVDANTLASDVTGRESNNSDAEYMMVTPKEIDLVISRSANLIAHSLNCALQPDIEPTDLLALTT